MSTELPWLCCPGHLSFEYVLDEMRLVSQSCSVLHHEKCRIKGSLARKVYS